jgi:filamentous hemagglutinin family protein
MKRLLLGAAVGGALAAPAFGQIASTTLPSGQQHGTGISVSTSGAQMTINQSTGREIINWQSFSIGSDAHVRFNLPGASSVVLNRVVGDTRSDIFGRLSSNGQVFLSNPNGVLFAPGASVEVGSLLATTLSISDQDFLAGRYAFANNGAAGTVINRGNILTPNGYTALAAPQVRNDGVIVAQLGAVALAAGDRVTLNMVEGSLIGISVEQAALNASIVNSGRLQADGGRVLLTASSANALLDTVINNTGAIRATRLEERDGQIVLQGGLNGIIRTTDTLNADSTIIDAGEIHIGDPVGLPPPPTPISGHAPVLIPNPEALRIDQETQRAIFTGSFSISASAATQILQPTASTALWSTTQLTTTPIAPSYGTLTLSSSIGPLSPVPHAVVGTGVSLPADGFLRLQ